MKTKNKISPHLLFKRMKGFTITEILVSIVIISILAGIVITVIIPARERAKDASIKSDLAQMQNEGELAYLEEGDYDNICCGGPPCDEGIQELCNNVSKQSGSPPTIRNIGNNLCIYAELNIVTGLIPLAYANGGGGPLPPPPTTSNYFCVDSFGFSDELPYCGICDSRGYCDYALCPDVNLNGIVDCGLVGGDIDQPITENCPAQGDPEFINSDLDCFSKCFDCSESNPSGCDDCGQAPCNSCPDFDGEGDEDPEECRIVYDLDQDGAITILDVAFVIDRLGTSCD